MARALMRVACGLALVIASVAGFAEGEPRAVEILLFPGPGPQARSRDRSASDVVRWNTGCETCHEAEAAAWRQSRHHLAFTNAAFTDSLAREPDETRAFCRGCHAPEAIDRGAPDAASELGVACVTCHVPLGPVLTSDKTADGAKESPHGLVRAHSFASVDACAGCHEFDFPRHRDGDAAMQRTVSEHRAAQSEATCVGCHMRRNDRPSHAFAGGYDEDLVRSAIRASAKRDGSIVRVTLTPERVTHSVPTGDMFRRLAVEVVRRGGATDETPLARAYLSRHYTQAADRRIEIGDDRPHEDAMTVALEVPTHDADEALAFRVVYERVGFLRDDDESNAFVESAFIVAEGSVTEP
jgi:hypothetical protein